eukprot:SAG31_NODE_7665_length_1622_cov_2.598818_1_plen_125_part_00
MTQEVAHQNPVPSTHHDFDKLRGSQLLSAGGYIGGALGVLQDQADLVELVPVFAANGPSAGVLEHESFLKMASELLGGVKDAAAAGTIDGVYFSMHGAMGTSEEHDPEGWLLSELRGIVGKGWW